MRLLERVRRGTERKYYLLLIVLILIYLSIQVFANPNSAVLGQYNLTFAQLQLLSLTIIVPAFGIWFAAFYSFIKLLSYTHKIKNSPDGRAFGYITSGLVVLGIGMAFDGVLTRLFTTGVDREWIAQSTSTIILSHFSILYELISFILLFIGTWLLVKTVKNVHIAKRHIVATGVFLLAVSVPYAIITLANPLREVVVAPAVKATYYMPDWLIITTIILPYIVMWAFGFFTVLLLSTYYKNIRGTLYKKSLHIFNKGLIVLIASIVLIQFLSAVGIILAGWELSALLAILYILLFVIVLGFVFIALGVKGLTKIEEVK